MISLSNDHDNHVNWHFCAISYVNNQQRNSKSSKTDFKMIEHKYWFISQTMFKG